MSQDDATASWSGYTYQGLIGMYVALYYADVLAEYEEDLSNYFIVFESIEDFAIGKYDNSSKVILEGHQVKNYKDQTPSKYYPAIRKLDVKMLKEPSVAYFLHCSNLPDLKKVKYKTMDSHCDRSNLLFSYPDMENVKNSEVFSALQGAIGLLFDRHGIEKTEQMLQIAASYIQSFLNEIIIETKSVRDQGNTSFSKEITFGEITELLKKTKFIIDKESIILMAKSKLSHAADLYCMQPEVEEGRREKIDEVLSVLLSSSSSDFEEFLVKVSPHKVLKSLLDLAGVSTEIENYQEILLFLLDKVEIEFDAKSVLYDKDGTCYRPTTIRAAVSQGLADQNLVNSYIPNILKNLNNRDLKTYFEVKNFIINGETVENIRNINVTKHAGDKKISKITDPEAERLVDINLAIEELNGSN